jgi:hypothetical protein
MTDGRPARRLLELGEQYEVLAAETELSCRTGLKGVRGHQCPDKSIVPRLPSPFVPLHQSHRTDTLDAS